MGSIDAGPDLLEPGAVSGVPSVQAVPTFLSGVTPLSRRVHTRLVPFMRGELRPWSFRAENN
jgi:hypothetical protein